MRGFGQSAPSNATDVDVPFYFLFYVFYNNKRLS